MRPPLPLHLKFGAVGINPRGLDPLINTNTCSFLLNGFMLVPSLSEEVSGMMLQLISIRALKIKKKEAN